jgi:hypothetical protein
LSARSPVIRAAAKPPPQSGADPSHSLPFCGAEPVGRRSLMQPASHLTAQLAGLAPALSAAATTNAHSAGGAASSSGGPPDAGAALRVAHSPLKRRASSGGGGHCRAGLSRNYVGKSQSFDCISEITRNPWGGETALALAKRRAAAAAAAAPLAVPQPGGPRAGGGGGRGTRGDCRARKSVSLCEPLTLGPWSIDEAEECPLGPSSLVSAPRLGASSGSASCSPSGGGGSGGGGECSSSALSSFPPVYCRRDVTSNEHNPSSAAGAAVCPHQQRPFFGGLAGGTDAPWWPPGPGFGSGGHQPPRGLARHSWAADYVGGSGGALAAHSWVGGSAAAPPCGAVGAAADDLCAALQGARLSPSPELMGRDIFLSAGPSCMEHG